MSFADHRTPGRCWLLLLTLAGASLFAAPASFAGITHDFRLLPDPAATASANRAYFVYQLAAGAVLEDAVLVKNMSEGPLRLALFAADAVTGSRGGIAVATLREGRPSRAGTWLRLSQSELALAAGESRSVAFKMSVPAAATPGEHGAAIVVQRAESGSERQTGPFGIRFVPRAAVTVLATVRGPAPLEPKLVIDGLETAARGRQQTVVARLANSGNDGIRTTRGQLTVRQTDGTLSRETPVQLGYVLAWGELAYGVGLVPALRPDHYDVTLSLTYDRGTVERTERLFLGEPAALPVVRAVETTPASDRLPGLPRWVVLALVGAGCTILLLGGVLSLLFGRFLRLRNREVTAR